VKTPSSRETRGRTGRHRARPRRKPDADATGTYPLQPGEITGLDLCPTSPVTFYDGAEATVDVGSATDIETDQSVDVEALADPASVADRVTPSDDETRYLFFFGRKGGVGKSTIAAARRQGCGGGLRDACRDDGPGGPPRHLRRAGRPRPDVGESGEPRRGPDRPGEKALEEYCTQVLDHVTEMYEDKGGHGDRRRGRHRERRGGVASPCAEEMAALEKFVSYFQQDGYDVVVFDTAPTGHAPLAGATPTGRGFMDLGSLTKGAAPAKGDQYDERSSRRCRTPSGASFAFVMYPEYTPMMEAYRAAEDLNDQVGIETAFVVANYLLPEEYGDNAFFANRRAQQEKYLGEIKDRFETPLMCARPAP